MDSDESRHVDAFIGKPTRRQVLQGAAAVGGAFALGPVIAACGGSSSSSSTSDGGGGGGPTKGGSLRVALTNGSVKDTLDPHIPSSEADTAYNFAMFDGLCEYDNDYRIVNALAEELTPNADNTEWMVRLRPDVVFHDGKPLTADDVVYSFERILDPKDPKGAADQLLNLAPGGTTKVDDKTVKFTLDAPNAVLLDAFASFRTRIVPVDFDPKKPIGTGPFKLKSYKPGDQAVFGPNADFWGEGPYVDELTMIIVVDNTARVNSLLGGSVEMIAGLPRAQAGTVEASAYKILRSETGAWDPFTMRIDQKPFDDVRVRQAFRLIVDRKQMVELAYAGYGSLGNDMCGRYDPGYPKDLPQREQDLEKAKSLLKEAGYEGLGIELVTSDGIGADVVAAAQVFAEQAKGAGVKVNIKKVDGGVFYGEDYLTYTFAQDYWNTRNYLMQAALAQMPRSPLNETHWKNDKWLTIVTEAFRTVDETKRNELVSDALTIEYDEGASILWAFRDLLDGYSDKLGGVKPDKSGSALGSYRFNVVHFK